MNEENKSNKSLFFLLKRHSRGVLYVKGLVLLIIKYRGFIDIRRSPEGDLSIERIRTTPRWQLITIIAHSPNLSRYNAGRRYFRHQFYCPTHSRFIGLHGISSHTVLLLGQRLMSYSIKEVCVSLISSRV